MRNFKKIFTYTLVDLVHHKSFYVMLFISICFVLLLKGCYKGDYTVNGQHVSGNAVAWNASIIAFHIISAGSLLIALLLSLGVFKRDKDDGSAAYMLSKPISRLEYVCGKIGGIWAVSFLFMFVIHVTIVIITYINTGGIMPGYLWASLMCSLNVFFMVALVSLLSLILPDFAAAFVSVGIVAIGYISDIIYKVAQSDLLKAALGTMQNHVSWWRIAWPKVCALQLSAESLIDQSNYPFMGAVHPAVNVCIYCGIVLTIFIARFNREEL